MAKTTAKKTGKPQPQATETKTTKKRGRPAKAEAPINKPTNDTPKSKGITVENQSKETGTQSENTNCINVKAAESGEQIKGTFQHLLETLKYNKVRHYYMANDTVEFEGTKYKIIGIDHDRSLIQPSTPTFTLMRLRANFISIWHDEPLQGGWEESRIREWINSSYKHNLPMAIHKYIVPVSKQTSGTMGSHDFTIDWVFIPSESELFGSGIYGHYEGERYEAFTSSNYRVLMNEEDYDNVCYWTRTMMAFNTEKVVCVTTDGDGECDIGVKDISDKAVVPVCFTIAYPHIY